MMPTAGLTAAADERRGAAKPKGSRSALAAERQTLIWQVKRRIEALTRENNA
jgi:hypothetical protein